jgi:hypothetical protein
MDLAEFPAPENTLCAFPASLGREHLHLARLPQHSG